MSKFDIWDEAIQRDVDSKKWESLIDDAVGWLIEDYGDRFPHMKCLKREHILEDCDAAAWAAGAVNASAKTVDDDYYKFKSVMANVAGSVCDGGENNGIIYAPTSRGQVSFHMSEEPPEDLPPEYVVKEKDIRWDRIQKQFDSVIVLADIIREKGYCDEKPRATKESSRFKKELLEGYKEELEEDISHGNISVDQEEWDLYVMSVLGELI